VSGIQFGIFTVGDVTPDPITWVAPTETERIRATVAIAKKAEEVGLDVFATGEHHNPPFVPSSPTTLLGYIAGQTERIILSTSTTLITTNDPVKIAERLSAPTAQSRAIGVHGRSMDMFDRMGIAEQLITTGIKTIAFQMYAGHRPLFRVPLGGVDDAFPFMLTTAQTETESILGEHLHSVGLAVERGVELVGLSQDSAAVQLRLRHPDGSIEQATTWTWTARTCSCPPRARWSRCRCATAGCGSSPRCARSRHRRTRNQARTSYRRSSIGASAASGCCARTG
jgi:hypothetical protein